MKKTILTLFILCALPITIWAQWSDNPNTNTIINDSTGTQAIPMVVTNSSGETYISWYSATEDQRYDVFLQKLDKNGLKLWEKGGLLISNHETQSWVSTYDLQLDNNENVLLVTQDFRTGNSDVFAYKISPDGDLLWGKDGLQLSNTLGGDYSPKMAIADNNDVVILFGNEPYDTLLNSTISVKRVSSDGNILWETQLSDTAWDYLLPQILHTENDDFIVSWITKTNLIDTTLGEDIFMHALAQKFDGNGNTAWVGNVPIDSGNIMLWLSLYTTPYLENDGNGGAYALWQSFTPLGTGGVPTTYLNRIYADGHIWKPNGYNVSNLSNSHHTGAEMIYMKNLDQIMVCWQEYEYKDADCWGVYGQMFDTNGQYLWDEYGQEIIPLLCSEDTAYYNVRLQKSTNNNAVIVYHKEYLNTNGTDTATITHLYSTSIDADGEKVWDPAIVPLSLTTSYKLHTVMGNLIDNQWVVAWQDNIKSPENYFNTGIYAQNLTVDGDIGPLGIKPLIINDDYDINLYPNPTKDIISVKYNIKKASFVQLDLMDVNGKLVKHFYSGNKSQGMHSYELDASGLSSGIYLVKLKMGSTVVYHKIVKK